MSLLVARDLWVAPPGDGPPDSRPGSAAAVVRGVSLELARGEWLALSGPNGCGKTCLALALAGLWPAQRGTLLLDGAPFGPHAPAGPAGRTRPGGGQRAAVGVVLQDPASQLLQPTVAEELAFTARNLGLPGDEAARVAAAWAARFGLEDDLPRDPHQLSAGRQQLVLIAAALAARPRLLVADEAGAHLDPAARAALLVALRAEVAAGLAVLWVTQEPEERAAADRTMDLPGWTGSPVERALSAPDAAPPGPPALTLRISPRTGGGNGPCVRTDSALEVRVDATGVTALEGPNGAGKSVLLSAAAGLLELAQVEVVRHLPAGHAALMTTQYPELQIFEERACDEVAYAAVSRGVGRAAALERAAGCLTVLGLDAEAFLDRRTWTLSGGEKRLLMVARRSSPPPRCWRWTSRPPGSTGAARRRWAGWSGKPRTGCRCWWRARMRGGSRGSGRSDSGSADAFRNGRQVPAKKRIDIGLSPGLASQSCWGSWCVLSNPQEAPQVPRLQAMLGLAAARVASATPSEIARIISVGSI